MHEVPGWIQAIVGIVGLLVALGGWAFRLQLQNANLTGRVTALENARNEDLRAIKEIANGQMAILVKLEGVLTELRLTRSMGRNSRKSTDP